MRTKKPDPASGIKGMTMWCGHPRPREYGAGTPVPGIWTFRRRTPVPHKISETLRLGCLCKEMKAPQHEQKLHMDSTQQPGFQKALDRDGDLRNLRCCS